MKEIRQERGLTQQQLADRAGLSRSYLSELESGSKPINDIRLGQLARALNVEVLALFDLSEVSPRFQRLLAIYLSLPSERQSKWIDLAEAAGEALRPDAGESLTPASAAPTGSLTSI